MADNPEERERRQQLPKMVSLREDAYYANCTMLETTPFDISILFGRVRPRTDEKGQSTLVEVYEKQVYLSHLQARALYDALGRSLMAAAPKPQQQQQ
jgi:hypothetical protein